MKAKKQARVKLLSRQQIEKAVHRYIEGLRKIRGFVDVEINATFRVDDPADLRRAVKITARYA